MARRPLWPGGAAALLHLHLEGGQVELVVEDGQRIEVELVEVQRLLHRVAAVVRGGLGLLSRTRWRPMRPSLIRLGNFFCHGPKP